MGKLKRYIVPAVSAVAVAVGVMFLRGIAEATDAADVFGKISDGFFSAAVLVGGTGLISLAGKLGTFDMLKYGTRTFFGTFFRGIREETPHTFYDYKEKQDGKGRKWLPEFAVVGGICLGIGVIATAAYAVM